MQCFPCSTRCCQRTLSSTEVWAEGAHSCSGTHGLCGRKAAVKCYADSNSPLSLKYASVLASWLELQINTFCCTFGSAHTLSHWRQEAKLECDDPGHQPEPQRHLWSACIFTRKWTVALEAHKSHSLCQACCLLTQGNCISAPVLCSLLTPVVCSNQVTALGQ